MRKLVGLDAPTTLLSVTDPDELQMIEFLQAVNEHLRREGPFRQQIMTHDFATVSGKSTYPLPQAFWQHLPRTYYNEDTDWRLIGPMNDASFQAFKEGELSTPSEFVWRIKGFDENPLSTEGRQIELYPTPAAVENLTFDFVSGHLYVPPNWAASTAYSSGDYVNVNGRIYLCDTNGTSSSTPPSGTDDNQSDGTTQWDHFDERYESIISNSDLCIFDADLVKLGLRAFYYTEKGGALAVPSMGDFERAIVKSKMRWEGQTSVLGGYRRGLKRTHNPHVSPGSWSFV